MKIDRIAKLQHLMQTLAFCLAVATIQWAFAPDKPYAPNVAYSVAIGTIIWAVIDIGRHWFPSAQETGWPTGAMGVLLVVFGIVAGYALGSLIGDALCRTFGWYAGTAHPDPFHDLRSGVLITLMAGAAGSFYFYARNRSAYLERKMGEARGHANEARLKLLEAQLEPHMLFNTLANLRALIGVDPARAQVMLDHMIAYLRATLAASRSTTHPLQVEFDRLRDYLELMAIRMGGRLQYALELPVALEQVKVPALLLQPLVENSIQHGLEPKVGGGRIVVSARNESGTLLLEVKDTGVGMLAADSRMRGSDGGGGFGLVQVRERLATLYGDAGSLRIESSAAEGTTAIIQLPVNA